MSGKVNTETNLGDSILINKEDTIITCETKFRKINNLLDILEIQHGVFSSDNSSIAPYLRVSQSLSNSGELLNVIDTNTSQSLQSLSSSRLQSYSCFLRESFFKKTGHLYQFII